MSRGADRSILPFGVLLLPLLFAALIVQPAAAQEDGHRFVAGREVSGGALGVLVIELWSNADPNDLESGDTPSFRFVVRDAVNETPLVPGPDLAIVAHRCVERNGDCDPATTDDTRLKTTLRDDADGEEDGRYAWRPTEGRLFGEPGVWRLSAAAVTSGAEPAEWDLTFASPVAGPASFLEELGDLVGVTTAAASRFFLFVLWVAGTVVVSILLKKVARRTVLHPARVDPTVGRLMGRLMTTVIVLVGIAVALWNVWEVNFWASLTTLGLLTVALGFGMQNTIANMMGGINLALDKPFSIGDRIQVGETWGDVQEIGLRSTRILTVKREVVIIPNKLLDEREIWNYTIDHPELRLDVDVTISYDSDRRLAENIMLEAAQEHASILSYPTPRVLLMSFQDSGLGLQLRSWLDSAKEARIVASDLRKNIKDRFDAAGVEIPYPYRTLVYKKELPAPHQATEKELAKFTKVEVDVPQLVYATGDTHNTARIAPAIARIARNLDMNLFVVHIEPRLTPSLERKARSALAAFQDAGAHERIGVKTTVREGNVVDVLKDVLKETGADLLVLGATQYHFLPTSRRVADVTREIRSSVRVPVMIVPRDLEIGDRTLQHYRSVIEARQKERRKGHRPGFEEGKEEKEGNTPVP